MWPSVQEGYPTPFAQEPPKAQETAISLGNGACARSVLALEGGGGGALLHLQDYEVLSALEHQNGFWSPRFKGCLQLKCYPLLRCGVMQFDSHVVGVCPGGLSVK